MVESCSECKHFRVPDDGQEWGLSGVCDHPSFGGAPVYDLLNAGFAEGVWNLPCGAPVVKQYHYCQFFEDKAAPGEIIDSCIKLFALELGK